MTNDADNEEVGGRNTQMADNVEVSMEIVLAKRTNDVEDEMGTSVA